MLMWLVHLSPSHHLVNSSDHDLMCQAHTVCVAPNDSLMAETPSRLLQSRESR